MVSRLLTLAIGLVAAACTSLPTPSAGVSPTGPSEQPATPSAVAVATPVPSAVTTPAPSAVRTPVPSASHPVQWREPVSYTFTLDSQCGERALIGRFLVEVENGKTVRVEGLEGYFASHPIEPRAVPTLNDLLSVAADARRQGASQVSVVLDPVDGHPVSVSVDWRADTIDDEECYEVTEYLPGSS